MAEVDTRYQSVAFCCTCSGLPARCKKVLEIKFSHTDSLGVFSGPRNIAKFSTEFSTNQNLSPVQAIAEYLSKRRGRFGYVVVFSGDTVVNVWDTMRGKDLTSVYKEKGTKCL